MTLGLAGAGAPQAATKVKVLLRGAAAPQALERTCWPWEARGPATAAAGTTGGGGSGEDEGGRTARAAEGRGQAAGGGRVAARRLAVERGERGARCEVRGVSTEGSAE